MNVISLESFATDICLCGSGCGRAFAEEERSTTALMPVGLGSSAGKGVGELAGGEICWTCAGGAGVGMAEGFLEGTMSITIVLSANVGELAENGLLLAGLSAGCARFLGGNA